MTNTWGKLKLRFAKNNIGEIPVSYAIQLIIAEELRLIRCLMERRLMVEQPHAFIDYQMEKFSDQSLFEDIDIAPPKEG